MTFNYFRSNTCSRSYNKNLLGFWHKSRDMIYGRVDQPKKSVRVINIFERSTIEPV